MRPARLLGFVLLAIGVMAGCARPVAPLPDAPLPAPTPPPPIVFPTDAGPHDALTEWWYYTGHLTSDVDGHRYGFEFVVFQVRREDEPTGYLAHFAVSDVDGQRFVHEARVAQSQTPLTAFPLEVGGWRLDSHGASDEIHASMADAPFALDLRLADEKPPALHHGGYIDYGPAGGSYYYSRTRLRVTGTLASASAEQVPVSGMAWMDHQWGNFVVAAAGGWDWYSLQLDDDSELMLYVLRSADGETTGVYGSETSADGTVRDLQPGSVTAEAIGSWTSPHTGAVYPSGWRLTLPDGARLVLEPQLRDQELWFPGASGVGPGAMAYWEGAVSVTGARTGQGYVELTGYTALSGTGR